MEATTGIYGKDDVDVAQTRRRFVACMALLAHGPAVLAQDGANYPNRPIHVIVPFTPGGGGDTAMRIISDKLAERLGVQVIIDNRPGATGYIGAQLVTAAAADGYTLLLGFDGSLVIAPNFYKAPFNTTADLAPVTKLNDAALVLAANPSLKARNLKELIAISKERSGGLDFGSSGAGSTPHLAGELLAMKSGLRLTHVPYKGGAQAVADVVGGQLPLIFTAVPTVASQLREGRLVPILVSGAKRSASLPDVPTAIESGVPGFDVSSWFGVFAPVRTPSSIVAMLHRQIVQVLSTPEVRERYLQAGFEPIGNAPEAFAAQVQEDAARWAALVKEGNIRVQ